jgi:TrmH family RNA methyltransferase
MPQITSPHNQRLKEIRKLRMRRREREQAGRFVAEGEDLLEAADAAGWMPVDRFVLAGSGLEGVEVEEKLLNQAAGLASGTRALAVYEERWAPAAVGPLCVYLHGVHDPGNVGTVLRSAEAFGASCVAIGPGTADPFSPKAVRASMGAVFGVPLARVDDAASLPGETVALVAGAGVELWRIPDAERPESDKVRELSILVGAERDGLPEALVAQADHVVHIPIRSQSLNAAMAATIALYELGHRMQTQ